METFESFPGRSWRYGRMETDVNYDDKHGEPIKLFVGQIPKSWEETEVRQILEPYGPIQELTVLKDRATGLHRGRCGSDRDE